MINQEKKKRIDALWLDSDFGKLLMCYAEDKTEEAEKLGEKIFQSGYWGGVSQLEDEIGEKIANELSCAMEFDEYLKALDAERPGLVREMIVASIFVGAIRRHFK